MNREFNSTIDHIPVLVQRHGSTQLLGHEGAIIHLEEMLELKRHRDQVNADVRARALRRLGEARVTLEKQRQEAAARQQVEDAKKEELRRCGRLFAPELGCCCRCNQALITGS